MSDDRAPRSPRAATPPASGSSCRAGAEPPFTVFINGVEQSEGADYSIAGGEIVFSRPIVKEKIGTGRWLAMYLGLFGTYRKDETIDLQFSRDGKVELLSDLPVVPYPEAP